MNEKVARARASARLLLMLALVIPLALLFAWVAAPPSRMPMFSAPQWYHFALPLVGAGGYLFGLARMVWIYRRSHLEPDTSHWRYRN